MTCEMIRNFLNELPESGPDTPAGIREQIWWWNIVAFSELDGEGGHFLATPRLSFDGTARRTRDAKTS